MHNNLPFRRGASQQWQIWPEKDRQVKTQQLYKAGGDISVTAEKSKQHRATWPLYTQDSNATSIFHLYWNFSQLSIVINVVKPLVFTILLMYARWQNNYDDFWLACWALSTRTTIFCSSIRKARTILQNQIADLTEIRYNLVFRALII